MDTLSDRGIIKGSADGSFRPNANATRSVSKSWLFTRHRVANRYHAYGRYW
ncbi:S-layer homology domain-containing protein [Paenibacillus antarcticus]|uniref:S-layer homology domain-containing protein n=1 Tax=Paenibacillus antarcticus TaxID=253703 RepID=UPI000A0380B2